jgi:hypothetical protein
MAGEAVASPMRLAAAPGRFARLAPPGNDDPCAKGARSWRACRAHRRCGEGGRATASTGPGQKSHVERRKASVPVAGYAGRLNAVRVTGLRKSIARRVRPWCAMNARRARPAADRERRLHAGHGVPIWVRRMHPSATGAPHAPREGASEMEEGKREGERKVEGSRKSEEM